MCELQVLDSEHLNYEALDARQYHGSAYGMVPATRGYLRPAGDVCVIGVGGGRDIQSAILFGHDKVTGVEFIYRMQGGEPLQLRRR